MPSSAAAAATSVRVKREPSPSPPRSVANRSFTKSKEAKRTSKSTTTTSSSSSNPLNNSASADTSFNDKTARIAETNAEILSLSGYAHYRSINEMLDKRTDWQLLKPDQLRPVLGADEVVAGLQPDEEDIWMFSCAHNVDVNALLGAKLQLSQDGHRRTLRSATSAAEAAIEYQAEVAGSAADAPLVSMLVRQSRGARKHQLVSFRPSGTVRLRPEVPEQQPIEVERVRNKLVPYPGGLKVRHPLHGAEYTERCSLAADVERKLRAAVRASQKAKAEEVSVEEEEGNEEQVRDADRKPKVKREREEEVAHKSTTVSRKRKATKAEPNGDVEEAEEEAPKKAKRVKKEKVKEEQVEDEQPAADLDWLSAI